MEGKKESLDKIKLGNLFQDPTPLSVLCKLSHYIHLLCFSWPTQLSLLYNKGGRSSLLHSVILPLSQTFSSTDYPVSINFLPAIACPNFTTDFSIFSKHSTMVHSFTYLLSLHLNIRFLSSTLHHTFLLHIFALIFLAIRRNHLSLRWWTTVSVEAQEHRKLMILCWHFRKLD